MKIRVPFTLMERQDEFVVEYNENVSAEESGFDALQDLPFDCNCCIGYPTLHAYFEHMKCTGYRRYCGWIQLIERQDFNQIDGVEVCSKSLCIDVSEERRKAGIPYFASGYPAELYDAPCKNLGGSSKLIWTAYTYFVEMPSRMNHNQTSYLAGFSWGYMEDITGTVKLLDFRLLSQDQWIVHDRFLKDSCGNFI